ncbi:MAG: ABC transporter ATP-binding protein [bacterium]
MKDILLNIQGLKTYFIQPEGVCKAVDDISFYLSKGESLGIIGESGSGKSVTVLSILKLIPSPPGKIIDGKIIFQGENIINFTEKKMEKIRGNKISMVFQEPMTSLNPVFTIGHQIGEAIKLHQEIKRKAVEEKTIEMLKIVNIPDPGSSIKRYPHEISGGMRQRVMIAMALSCNPAILIADEPTTALDVTIQAQILDLMLRLKEEFGMSIILITHDFGVIAETVKRVIVMYGGKIVEEADTNTILENPKHPYTQGLLRAIPSLSTKGGAEKKRLYEIPGLVPVGYALPSGCKFSTRCEYAADICFEKEPPLMESDKKHLCRCWKTNI